MTITVTLLVLLIALIAAVVSAFAKPHLLWVAVVLLAIAGLLRELPR